MSWRVNSVVLALSAAALSPAHALFEDAEARRAILELRQRFETVSEENAQARRSLLDLQAQIDGLRSELAGLRGRNEELERETVQLAQGVDQRMSRFEPMEVEVDGLRFTAQPQEKSDFESALELFRAGELPKARQAFAKFINTYVGSAYIPSARFWLGSAQYAAGDYKDAVANFRAVVKAGPEHKLAPDAALSLSDSLLEVKNPKESRQVLETLVKTYPNAPAAAEAKERLKRK